MFGMWKAQNRMEGMIKPLPSRTCWEGFHVGPIALRDHSTLQRDQPVRFLVLTPRALEHPDRLYRTYRDRIHHSARDISTEVPLQPTLLWYGVVYNLIYNAKQNSKPSSESTQKEQKTERQKAV